MTDAELDLCGERVRLLPERGLVWERTATLVAADLHWGKAAAFRAAAIPVPAGTTSEGLARLGRALDRTVARRLVVLGDLFHARRGRVPSLHDAIQNWRAARPGLEIVLVRGNHDRGAGDPPAVWDVRCVNEPWVEGPFAFRHFPEESPEGYTLAGHLHPAVRLAGVGRQRATLPCFLFGDRVGLLPSFGPFTGRALVRPKSGERVFVIAGDEVVGV
jgi:DNA ligase-associated metallophosphoesterase